MHSVEKYRCPSCGGTDTRRSYRDGLLDTLMQIFRKRPYRCRGCRRRFYEYDGEREQPEVKAEQSLDQHVR